MGEWNFNRKQCVRALVRLGFIINNKRYGQHDKYDVPNSFRNKLPPNVPPFIMVPRHNELRIQKKIVKEIELIGGVELVEKFKQYL